MFQMYFLMSQSKDKLATKIEVEPKTAFAIITDNKIGRGSFQMMKKVLQVKTKHNIFPSWEMIRAFRNSVTTPTINIMKTNEEDIEYFGGRHFSYTDAVTITIKQLS